MGPWSLKGMKDLNERLTATDLVCNGKWSSLNAPGTETPQSYPYWEREILPTPIISPLG